MTTVPLELPANVPVMRTTAGSPVSRWTKMVGKVTKPIVAGVVIVIGLLWLVPTFGLFVDSLRSPANSSASGWWEAIAHPSQLTFQNYVNIVQNSGITTSLWNTALITVPATLGVVVLGSMAAYALAWVKFPGRDAVFIITVALIIVPVQVAIIPDAKIYGHLNIYGSILCVVLFHVAFGLPFAIFLLRNFFSGIPKELMEAARMDGAGEIFLFRKIILPLGWPAIASLAIYQFMWVWNDLLVALVFASPSNAPITYALYSQMRTFSTNIDVIAPGAFISMIIPLAVFFGFQRYFVQGILAGSVK